MRYLTLFALLIITACAPLNPQSTPTEKAGEVALRTVLFPLTLGFSEWGFYNNYQQAQRQGAYNQWYGTLSSEEKDREVRRQGDAGLALGLALSGRPLLQQPTPALVTPAPARSQRCVTNQAGSSFYTSCD